MGHSAVGLRHTILGFWPAGLQLSTKNIISSESMQKEAVLKPKRKKYTSFR
jgi:hypothetical protein